MQIKNADYLKNQYNFKEENIVDKGEIITGEIISEDEKEIKVQFENFSLNFSKNEINAKLGEKISFEVLENKNNKLSLKQIYNKNEIKPIQLNFEQELNKKNNNEKPILDNGVAYKNFLHKNKDTQSQDNLFKLKELKDNLNHIANAGNEQSIEQMLKNSLDPEKNPPFTMSDYIQKSMGIDLENKENDQTDLKEEESNIKMDLNMNGVDEEDILNFEEVLTKAGLPMTNKNIEALKSLQNKFENIGQLTDNQIKNILRKEGNITLEDIYTSKHLGDFEGEKINLDTITNLDEQIKNILISEEISLTNENIDLAKDFVKSEIEISKENFKKYEKLKNFKQNFELNNILEKGAINIGLNKSLNNIEIFEKDNINFNNYNKLVKILPNIKVENIQSIINNNIPINLQNIENEYNKNLNYENIQISERAISERLNLAKIQMKLTTEAIYRLSESGININTKPLQDVINTLESLETEQYKNSLKIVNAPINNENIGKMQKVYSAISTFSPKLVYSTFKDIINNEIDFSIKGISNSIKSKNILDTFETFKTVPDSRFGDKISNLKGEFEKILTENGFEVTESNLKASKILTLNDMDFNEENLLNVKLIDSKLEYVYNKLHPIIASKMIKQGFNPIESKIDDLINYIDNFSKEFGQSSKEKIAENILELDKENKLTKDERSAIISVYRMLNLIEKDNSGSIGTLLKNEKNVTLGNLLEASKIYKKTKKKIDFNVKIDDKTEIKEGTNSENNIINSIERGLENNKNLEYNKLLLNGIINNITPEKVLEYTKKLNEVSIETMYEEIKEQKNILVSEQKKNDILEKTKNIDNVGQEIINYMIKNNIPITINNIYNMEKNIKDNLKNSDSIDKFKNDLNIRNIDFGQSIFNTEQEKETLEEALKSVDKLEVENEEVFDDIINLEDLNDIKYMILQNKNVSSSIKFIKDINKSENGIYNLPLRLSNGKVTDLNMFVLNSEALNSKNVNLFLQFENGFKNNLQAYVKVNNNGSFANITAESQQVLQNIENNEKDILNILKKFGIEPNNIKYSLEINKNIFDETSKEEIKNKIINLESEFETLV